MRKAVAFGVFLLATLLIMVPASGQGKGKGAEKAVPQTGHLDQVGVWYQTALVEDRQVMDSSWWGPAHDTSGMYYDTSEIKITSGGHTLHDVLAFYQSFLIERDYFKPYVSVKEGDNFYTARGELINYQFAEDAYEQCLEEGYSEDFCESYKDLEGKKRRAVVNAGTKLYEDESGELQFDWWVYRVDYYTRSKGRMQYLHSLIYSVWNDQHGSTRPEGADSYFDELLYSGPANVGGQ